MLVRDKPEGRLEVFMLRRNLNSDFVGGAYVFPGGGVDASDRELDLEAICGGRTDAECSARLGIERGGLAFWVAAVRECFEEAGVLLARKPGDEHVLSFAEPEVAARFEDHRDALNKGERSLVEIVREEGLELDVSLIHYWSHWITPEGPPRRYDTRFFVAAAPPEQVPLHDDAETIAHLWVEPADALERHRRGELEMIFPTIRNLEGIAAHGLSASLLEFAAGIGDVPAILPRIVSSEGEVRILVPGDEGYEEAAAGAGPG